MQGGDQNSGTRSPDSGVTVLVCRRTGLVAIGGAILIALLTTVGVGALVAGSNIGLLFLLLAAVTAVFVLPRLRDHLRWDAPELHVQTHPLRLGSHIAASFVRTPTGVRLANGTPLSAEFRLVCEERATYRQGTDTRTETAKVVDHRWTSTGTTAEAATIPTTIPVPDTAGAPTFDLGNNEVRWTLEVTPLTGPIPRSSSSFDIVVAPSWRPAPSTPQDA